MNKRDKDRLVSQAHRDGFEYIEVMGMMDSDGYMVSIGDVQRIFTSLNEYWQWLADRRGVSIEEVKPRRGGQRGNVNAEIAKIADGSFVMRVKAGYADMIAAAMMAAGNPALTQRDLEDAVYAALRHCYERKAEAQAIEEMIL